MTQAFYHVLCKRFGFYSPLARANHGVRLLQAEETASSTALLCKSVANRAKKQRHLFRSAVVDDTTLSKAVLDWQFKDWKVWASLCGPAQGVLCRWLGDDRCMEMRGNSDDPVVNTVQRLLKPDVSPREVKAIVVHVAGACLSRDIKNSLFDHFEELRTLLTSQNSPKGAGGNADVGAAEDTCALPETGLVPPLELSSSESCHECHDVQSITCVGQTSVRGMLGGSRSKTPRTQTPCASPTPPTPPISTPPNAHVKVFYAKAMQELPDNNALRASFAAFQRSETCKQTP